MSDSIKNRKCFAVIPSIEGLYLLRRLLPTIDLPKENIIIVDQGSLDGTESFCNGKGHRVLQLKKRATFTQAVNEGVKNALDLGADYVLVINNDTEFKTSIATQLVRRMSSEYKLGLLAPRQIIVDQEKEALALSRVYWDIGDVAFNHDVGFSSDTPELLESDFCEFTCVLISKELILEIGLLDERYEFYHEDADYGYRCLQAGYRCAYDQTAIIKHYHSSTVNKQSNFNKHAIIARNKNYFARDYVGVQIRVNNLNEQEVSSWSLTNSKLYTYLKKFGVVTNDLDAPSLSTLAHPDMVDTDFLLTVWETTKLPKKWLSHLYKFKHIFVPSQWNVDVFKEAGFTNVSLVPFGVDVDTFNPWGATLNLPWGKSILTVCRGQYRKALDVTEKMWLNVKKQLPGVYLVLYGKDTGFNCLDDAVFESRVVGSFVANICHELQIVHLIPAFGEFVSEKDLAQLYRSVDLYLLNSRSEGFGYPVLEAMACGTLTLIPNYGSVKEFATKDNCLTFNGELVKANYFDKGFGDIGFWWEPNIRELSDVLVASFEISAEKKSVLIKNARNMVLTKYTWRHMAMVFKNELEKIAVQAQTLGQDEEKNDIEKDLSLGAQIGALKTKQSESRFFEYLTQQSMQLTSQNNEIKQLLLSFINKYSLNEKTDQSFGSVSVADGTSIEVMLEQDDDNFLNMAYLTILGREADIEGKKHYLLKLRDGHDRIDIMRDIKNSKEGQAKKMNNKSIEAVLNKIDRTSFGWKNFFGLNK